MDKGAEVNAVDRGGLIPLHNAASYGHVEIAQVLLSHGSHVNANDRWQFTPLHEAAQKGYLFIKIHKKHYFLLYMDNIRKLGPNV